MKIAFSKLKLSLLFLLPFTFYILPSPLLAHTYKVGIQPEDRFMIQNSDETYSGFEVELWNEIAKQLKLDFQFVLESSFPKLLEDLKDGNLDLAIATITMTYDRSQYAEFSYPYFITSLGILTKEKEQNSLIKVLHPLLKPIVGKTVILFMLVMFIFGNILWFTERQKHSIISPHYFPGIFQAMWCTFAIQSTIGFGDIIPHRWIARLLSIPIWLFGIFMVAIITAQLLTAYTNEQEFSSIHNYHDLRGKIVATVANTTSAKILDTLDVRKIILVNGNLATVYPDIARGRVDAIVYDYPYLATIANFLKKQGSHPYLVPESFDQQMYSIALNKNISNSNPALIKNINEKILEFRDNGFIDHLKFKWFGDLGIR